jgi:hypothetical protein
MHIIENAMEEHGEPEDVRNEFTTVVLLRDTKATCVDTSIRSNRNIRRSIYPVKLFACPKSLTFYHHELLIYINDVERQDISPRGA